MNERSEAPHRVGSRREPQPDRSRAGPFFVIGSLEVGGAESHICRIAPRLKALGWDPVVYCMNRRGQMASSLAASGIEVLGPPAETLTSSRYRAAKALAMGLSGLRLLRLYLMRRPQIAHFFLPQAYLLGGSLALLARVPIRVMSRRSQNTYRHRHPGAWALEVRLHRHMTALLGNSRSVVRQLVEEEGCDPARTFLIYNGIDIEGDANNRGALRRRLGLGEHALVMTIVANLIPYKGHADLLQALASIHDRLPSGWRLLCAGRDDGCQASLLDQADMLGIRPHIEFLGQRHDVPDLLALSDIGLLCSHEEGFSNSIIEAMACGLPMIVTDVGGNAEAVIDGETGMVVPPRDPETLGKAILQLAMVSQADREAMGERGRRRAADRFSLDACVAAYDRLYRELLSADAQ